MEIKKKNRSTARGWVTREVPGTASDRRRRRNRESVRGMGAAATAGTARATEAWLLLLHPPSAAARV